MKKFDFTKTGGLPFTQEVLDFLQTAYNEQIAQLAACIAQPTANLLTPVILSGMQYETLTKFQQGGYFYYNGEIIRFGGGNVNPLPAGQAYYLQISTTTTALSLLYNNGSSPQVMSDKLALWVALPNTTATTATQFPWTALTNAGSVFGAKFKDAAFTTVNISITGVTGTISYKKNYLTNTLQLIGSLNVTEAASPPEYSVIANLPVAYWPNNTCPFSAYYRYHESMVMESTSKDYLRQINMELTNGGFITGGFLSASTSSYALTFNTLIPLD